MKIGFYCNSIPFEADLLENGLAGGSENALVNIVYSWKKNNPDDEITVYNQNSEKYSEYNGITWKSIFDFNLEIRTANLDVLISLRDPEIFYIPYLDVKIKVLWSQDIMNEPRLIVLKDHKYGIENIDIIFANSQFSYNNLKKGFPNSDIKVLLNGYNSDFICDDIEKEDIAIFNSTPFRGLSYLLELWPKIYEGCIKYNINPKLKIYGGLNLYNQSNDHFNDLYSKLSKMVNTTVFGSISQKELYKKMCKSRLLLYPCNYLESSCMAMIESIACGVWPISTNIGALNELIIDDKSGNIINLNTESKEYKEKFIKHSIEGFVNKGKPTKNHLKTWNEQSILMRQFLKEKL